MKKSGEIERSLAEMLQRDNDRLKRAGDDLAIAAIRVVDTYDGIHRLRLAVAGWNKAIADEGGRASPPEFRRPVMHTDEASRCIACDRLLLDGDLVHSDESGGTIHAACCGPERESYVNAEGEPLGPDDPIPTPWTWRDRP